MNYQNNTYRHSSWFWKFLPPVQPNPNVSFILNHFEGDFNPATPEGSKLFMKTTEGPKDEKLLEVLQENCKAVMNLMHTFGFSVWLGSLINLLPVYTTNGMENKSILHHRKALSVRDVQAQA